MKKNATTLITVLAATVSASLAFASAALAGKHVDQPVPGGKIVLKDRGDELRKLKVKLPAQCESNNGRRDTTKLKVSLAGRLPIEGGRFKLGAEASNGVEVNIRGKRVAGGYKGKVRLTYLDLDFVGPSDDSFLCDSGTVRYRTG